MHANDNGETEHQQFACVSAWWSCVVKGNQGPLTGRLKMREWKM